MKKTKTQRDIVDWMVEIMRMALFVNRETKHDVIINFAGHVDYFSVDVFYNGWGDMRMPDFHSEFYLTDPDCLNQCEKTWKKLDSLLR